MTPLSKEVCPICTKCINIGQFIVECCKCDCVMHHKCYDKSQLNNPCNDDFYCLNCIHFAVAKYNPFKLNFDQDEGIEEDNETLLKVAQILDNCKSYSVKEFNRAFCNQTSDYSSIFFQNIDGNKSNFDTLAVETNRYNTNFSVIALAETNVSPELSSLYQLTGYNSFYQNTVSNKRKGTGVALYVSNTLSATVDGNISFTTENIETLFVKISSLDTQVVTVGVIYRPPSGDVNAALTELSQILDDLPKGSFISGDFNIDLHDQDSAIVKQYEDILFSKGFFPLISLSTHEKPGCQASCIDNILTNDPENVLASGTLTDRITHHSPIFQMFNMNIDSSNESSRYKQYYDYSQPNVKEFVRTLEQDLGEHVIDNFNTFHNIYKDCIDKTCKLETPKCSKRTVKNNPWITPGLITKITYQHELYDDWVKVRKIKCKNGEIDYMGGTCHCPVCCDKRQKYNRYKNYRREVKKDRKGVKEKYFAGKFLETQGNSKKTWKLINDIRGKRRRQIKPLFTIDNEKITNRRIIANEFNKYFVSLASNLNEAYNDIGELVINSLPSFCDYMPRANSSSIFLRDCTPDEINKIISELNNGKSSDIPIHVVKASSEIIAPILSTLYNECMSDGVFPDDLKTGRITPIYKKDNEELLENYRPVSTLAVFGKIFEKIIFNRLYSFFQSQQTIYDNQFGFRKNHSTSHALNFSVNYIESCLEKKQHVLGIFIDLSKAFDTISHDKLLSKLDNYGIRGNANRLIASYLSNRYQYVSVLEENSDKLPVLYGVPQGSCLGPLLFIIYINDISRISQLGKFVLFADDTNIFVVDRCRKTLYQKANEILRSLQLYMKCNLLHINIKKCCYIHFKPSRSDNSAIEDEILTLNNIVIKKVAETKFLGVIIDDQLSWKAHIQSLNSKLKCEIGKLCRIRHVIPEKHHKELYHTLFESHLRFGISVWGGVSNNRLEPIFVTQKKCIRILFGDLEAYLDKFKTCARTRPCENQKLGSEFYEKEHTKPLFKKNSLLTVHNLYKYTCLLEFFKINKLECPKSLHSLYRRSQIRPERIITPSPSTSFIYKSSKMWSDCRKSSSEISFLTSTNSFKSRLKSQLLDMQSKHDANEWCEYNLGIEELKF